MNTQPIHKFLLGACCPVVFLALTAVPTSATPPSSRALVMDYGQSLYRSDDFPSIPLKDGVVRLDSRSHAPTHEDTTMATQFRMLEKPILHFTKGDTHCAAVVIDEEPGGSGTFVNLAVAFGNRKGSNLFLLGDRVAVTSIKIENGLLCVNYLDHANRQPLAERPTAPVTKYFTLNRETLEAARATKGE